MIGALYRLLALALPPGFRREWGEAALRDLDELLRVTRARSGRLAASGVALRAVLDVTRAIPREWWRVGRRFLTNELGGWEVGMNRWTEIRLALRSLGRRPGFTATAVLTLALGIGSTVAIFTVVNAVLFRPLPYPDAEELIAIRHHAPAIELPTLENSPGTIRLYREHADFIEGMAAYDSGRRNLIGGPRPEEIRVVAAEPSLFDVLAVRPAIGRPFTPADLVEDRPLAMILSWEAWTTRFGSDPAIVGTSLRLDDQPIEVVGVMPRGFAFPDGRVDAYLPFRVDPEGDFGSFGTRVVARLAPGVDREVASARTEELQARLVDLFPDDLTPEFLESTGWSASVVDFKELLVGEDVRSALWIVLGTVGFVLLIACANVANLFLVRAESRQKEVAIRSAMGAGSGRIALGFLDEALSLGVAGGLVGVGLAWGAVELLVSRGPSELPRLHEVGLDATSLLLAGGVSVLAAIVLGIFPLSRTTRGGLAGILRDGNRTSTDGVGRHGARNVLVAGQMALALVLLVGSGLMLRSFQALRSVELGFDPDRVTSVGLSVGEDLPEAEAAPFYERVAEQVAALPGVESVGLTNHLPIGGSGWNGGSFYIESRPRDDEALPPVAMYKVVGADYLDALRHPLVEGRALTRADWEGGPPVILVNQAFADQFLDGRALGERLKWDESTQFAEVVGVVGDVREAGIQPDVRPVAYLPMMVGDWGYPELDRLFLLVRTAPGTSAPVTAIRDIVARADPDVPITAVRTMDEVVASDMAQTSFTMVLLGLASGVAVLLGAVGLFGVVSYVVAQRTREIGVRVALGADRAEIRSMVLRQGVGVATVGVVLGLVGAWGLSRVMGAILFEVSVTDPVSFAAAPLLLVGVATLATWLPARRASSVDPVEALRAD